MASPEVEEFAHLLMQHVRDSAIAACDMLRRTDCNAASAIRWRQKIQAGKMDDLLAEVIPDCIDEVLFYLLYAIDNELLAMSFTTSSGKLIDLSAAGRSEMAGWAASGGPESWRARFSKERFHDDFQDLDLNFDDLDDLPDLD